MSWTGLDSWWLREVEDPVYREEVLPLLLAMLRPQSGELYLDLGCGEGRVMAEVAAAGARVVGCDLSLTLLERARRRGAVVMARLPDLSWARPGSVDGAYLSLVIDHLPDEAPLLGGAASAVRDGGVLAVVVNHPYFTAPGSTPVEDEDGEILWRPGAYLSRGFSEEAAGEGTVRFHHRSLGDLLTAASAAGWDLQSLEERGASPGRIEREPDLAGQDYIPRLLAARWVRRPRP